MYLLGIDLESDSLDTANANILELAAVIYDWEAKAPVKIISALIDPGFESGEEYTVPEEITDLTGITTQQIREWGECEKDVLNGLASLESYAHYYVAHNGNVFDKPLLLGRFQKCGVVNAASLGWIDTTVDVKYPEKIKTRNLCHLAAEHNVLNPFRHRALFDVLTMFEIMKHYDLDAIIARSRIRRRPRSAAIGGMGRVRRGGRR